MPKASQSKSAGKPERASRSRALGQKPAEPRGTASYEPVSVEAVNFGKALSSARQVAGYSQARLGKELGRSQAAVATWEHGVYLPVPHDVFRMEQLFGIPAGSLSQHLGYLPVTGSGRSTPAEVTGAILKDGALSDRDKKVVLDLYRTLVRTG